MCAHTQRERGRQRERERERASESERERVRERRASERQMETGGQNEIGRIDFLWIE